MIFKGKIDKWYLTLMIVTNILLLVLIVNYWKWGTFLCTIIIELITIPLLINNSVILKDKMFTLKFGLSKNNYLIDDIVSMRKCNDLMAGSACSTDRVYIVFKYNDIVIALKDNDLFMQELLKIKTSIKIM